LESERDDILWYMPQIEIPAEDPCLSMEIQDLDIVFVSKQEFPRKSEHYDCDAELAREYIDPITMSKIWIWHESMCRIGTRN